AAVRGLASCAKGSRFMTVASERSGVFRMTSKRFEPAWSVASSWGISPSICPTTSSNATRLRKCLSSFDAKLGRRAGMNLFPGRHRVALVLFFAAVALLAPAALCAQDAAPVLDNTGFVENPKPTWETQKKARTFVLGIPAPRGQITDRNGKPFAQTRLSYNLAISFPAPLDWQDSKILDFTKQQITLATG